MNDAQTTIRMPKEVLAQLKDQYANTYALHRLSFNAWLVERLTTQKGGSTLNATE